MEKPTVRPPACEKSPTVLEARILIHDMLELIDLSSSMDNPNTWLSNITLRSKWEDILKRVAKLHR